MSRINFCPACSLYDKGGKSRIAIEHTCGKGEKPQLPLTDGEHKKVMDALFPKKKTRLFK